MSTFARATTALVSFDAVVIAVIFTLIIVIREPITSLVAGVGGPILGAIAAIIYMRMDLSYD